MSEVAATKTPSDDKLMAIVATIPFVGLVILLASKDASPVVKNYAKQSNALLALWVISFVIAMVPFVGWMISFFLGLVELVAWIMLVINASELKMYKLPVIGEFFDGLMK